MRHHELGFAQLGAGDATGTRLELKTGDIRALVSLAVGSPGGVVVPAVLGDSGDIRFESVQVEDENGSGQLLQGAPDEVGRCCRHAWKSNPLTTSSATLSKWSFAYLSLPLPVALATK